MRDPHGRRSGQGEQGPGVQGNDREVIRQSRMPGVNRDGLGNAPGRSGSGVSGCALKPGCTKLPPNQASRDVTALPREPAGELGRSASRRSTMRSSLLTYVMACLALCASALIAVSQAQEKAEAPRLPEEAKWD